MKRIIRWDLKDIDCQTKDWPRASRVLGTGSFYGQPVAYVMIDDDVLENTPIALRRAQTDFPVSKAFDNYQYVGSVLVESNGKSNHYFIEVPVAPEASISVHEGKHGKEGEETQDRRADAPSGLSDNEH